MPTRTTNKIHFNDLDPIRFEDLCHALLFGYASWDNIQHYGRAGQDEGIDLHAVETLEDGVNRRWAIQCKRYSAFRKPDATSVIDAIIKREIPDVILLILGCDPTKKVIEHYIEYAKKCGIAEPRIWTASTLEAILYNQRKDLLFAYFGISLSREMKTKERQIKHCITLKKQMARDFLKNKGMGYKAEELDEILINPSKKFDSREVIIHNIDDDTYPNTDTASTGISSWFRLGLYDFYFNGLEVCSYCQAGIINSKGEWKLLLGKDAMEQPPSGFQRITIQPFLRIPFKNIVAYDLEGDEYYNYPHIYCRFSEGGSPYEDEVYRVVVEGKRPGELNSKFRLK